MREMYLAGIGFADDMADTFWRQWWAKAEENIKSFLSGERVIKLGKEVQIPDLGLPMFKYQRFLMDTSPIPFVAVYRVVGEELFLSGFGLLAFSEYGARDQLDRAKQFLREAGIRHPSAAVTVWVFSAPVSIQQRRLV